MVCVCSCGSCGSSWTTNFYSVSGVCGRASGCVIACVCGPASSLATVREVYHTHTHTHTQHPHKHTNTQTHKHTNTHKTKTKHTAVICACTHTRTQTCMHIVARMHAHTHTPKNVSARIYLSSKTLRRSSMKSLSACLRASRKVTERSRKQVFGGVWQSTAGNINMNCFLLVHLCCFRHLDHVRRPPYPTTVCR